MRLTSAVEPIVIRAEWLIENFSSIGDLILDCSYIDSEPFKHAASQTTWTIGLTEDRKNRPQLRLYAVQRPTDDSNMSFRVYGRDKEGQDVFLHYAPDGHVDVNLCRSKPIGVTFDRLELDKFTAADGSLLLIVVIKFLPTTLQCAKISSVNACAPGAGICKGSDQYALLMDDSQEHANGQQKESCTTTVLTKANWHESSPCSIQ